MIIHYHTEYLVQLWLLQTKHIHDHSLPHIILGSTMITTNGAYPWSFITTQNTCYNYDYNKRNKSMIIYYHSILGSTMTTTNRTYSWSFTTTLTTSFNHDYDKRNISMIIHYNTEYLVQPWLRQTKHIHDH